MLKNRNFMMLWIAQFISAAGDTFSFLALAVRIDGLFEDPGASASALGLVLIAFALPTLVLGIFAGTLVDRLDRKWVMIGSDLARALIAPAFLLLRTPADLPIAFAAAFSLASFGVFFYPARTALVPTLVAEEQLLSANGWMQLGNTMARLTGPIVAGIVVGKMGTSTAFWVDAASFLVSALFVLGIRGVITRAPVASEKQQSAWQDLLAGIRYATRSRLLQGITLGIGTAMLGLGAVNVLFVPFLSSAFQVGPEGLGSVQGAQGIGMLVGALAMGGLGKRMPPLVVAVASMVILGVGVAVFGLAPGYVFTLLIIPFIGLAIPPVNAALSTMLQRGVSKDMLGRAGSVMDMAISLTNLISMGAAGWLGGVLGLRETFVLAGVLIFIGGLGMGTILKGDQAVQARTSLRAVVQRVEAPLGD